MRKVWLAVVLVAEGILIGGLWFVPTLVGAHMGGGGMMGMMGPGMMMGLGMMGWSQQELGYGGYPNWQEMLQECEEMMGQMMDHGYSRYAPPKSEKQQTGKALTKEDVTSIVQNYLNRTKNPNLKIGKVEKKEDGNYLVEIVTKDGSLVDKLEVNQFTGWMRSIYSVK